LLERKLSVTDLVTLNVSAAVRNRYSEASQTQVAALCCPVSYDPRFLDAIPREVIERDYGCGDPSKYVQPGDVVLDLGAGGGKICFIAAQVVGPSGRVIGIDCNDDMLELARRSQPEVARRIGFDNVQFRKGQIQDLKLDLDRLEAHLREQPVGSSADWLHAHEHADELRRIAPLVADQSIDVVVSNCVLNLVRSEDRRQLFAEIYRVLKPGGRAVISDIVSSADVPASLQNNPELWSGCLSGAYREDRFLAAFERTGFGGLEILERQSAPWQVVAGIEFRSLTVRAHKLPLNCCADWDGSQATDVVYRGPWKSVQDDSGTTYPRGERLAVCSSTADMLHQPPYAGQMLFVDATASCCETQPNSNLSGALSLAPEPNCCGPTGCC
jgi:SAM-dependent methyltransferase